MLARVLLQTIFRDINLFYTIFTAAVSVSLTLFLLGFDSKFPLSGYFLFSGTIGFVFTLIYSLLYHTKKALISYSRRVRFKYPWKIAIMAGSIVEGDIPCPLDTGYKSPSEWKTFLESKGYAPKIISVMELNDDFIAVINPYKEKYPEEDIARRTSFFRIVKFIENGGLFLSTAGLPFFYMWDSRHGPPPLTTGEMLEEQTAGSVNVMPGQTNFLRSWFREYFRVKTTFGAPEHNLPVFQLDIDREVVGEILSPNTVVTEFRAAVFSPLLIPLIRARKDYGGLAVEECYPLAASKFGLGYIVTVGFVPETIGNQWFGIVSNSLVNLLENLSRKGSLDKNADKE